MNKNTNGDAVTSPNGCNFLHKKFNALFDVKDNTADQKKNNSTQILTKLDIADKSRKHPNVKYLAPTKYTEATANGLTRMVCDYIKFSGGMAERVNSMGIYDVKLKRFRPSGSRKGTSDIKALFNGKSLSIEVKIGRDKLSNYQREYANDVIKSGGFYFVATNFADFHQWFENLKICRP
jgi:hypothetical protein